MAKRKKFRKGSPEAKAFMARLRNMKRKGKRKASKVIRSASHKVKQHLQPLIVKGEFMEGRKRKRRKARKSYSGGGSTSGGGRKRRRSSPRRRSHRRYSGAGGTIVKKLHLVDTLKEMGALGLGAIGGSMVANLVPVKSAKIKACIPIAIGMLLPLMPKLSKNAIIRGAGLGSLAIGTISLIRQFVPNVPLLAGGETAETVAGAMEQLDGEEALLLGEVLEGADFDGALIEGEGGIIEGADGYEGALIEGAGTIGPENYS